MRRRELLGKANKVDEGPESMTIPKRVDLRALLGNVLDQGNRMTCVAFAVTSCHELWRAHREELSVEALHWGARAHGASHLGSTLEAAAKALYQTGQPLSVEWPYNPELDEVIAEYVPPPSAEACRPWLTTQIEEMQPNVRKIKSLIANGIAVALIVPLHTGFDVPADGHIASSPNCEWIGANHAVALVGYDEAMNCFLLRNSWGPDWGLGGYAYIQFDFVSSYGIRAAAIQEPETP